MQFCNPKRIEQLHSELTSGRSLPQICTNLVKIMKQKNKNIVKDLQAARVADTFADNVYVAAFPNGQEMVVKTLEWQEGENGGADSFENFQELACLILTTHAVNQGRTRNFVRLYDIFVAKGELYMLMERLQGDLETVDNLADPDVMWNVLYQFASALEVLQSLAEIVHFDIRHDNVLVEHLSAPVQLYPSAMPQLETSFVLKIADFGQAELTLSGSRARNAIHVGEHDEAKWGAYPVGYAPNTGYDMQYFLYTLPCVLDGYVDQYYVLTGTQEFIEDGLARTGDDNRTADQFRPTEVSRKTAAETVAFLADFYHTRL